MKRIFDGEIYELIVQNGSLVFPYCKSSNESAVCVSYKMISDENKEPTDVAKNIYLLSKFGSNYRSSSELCTNYVLSKTAELQNGLLCLVTDSGAAYLVDQTGMPLWSGDINYKGEVPSDIVSYKNGLWASYSKAGVLIRFNLNTMREELRIGGKSSPFNKPNNIFINGKVATISNAGSNKLINVDLESYIIEEKEEFTESVYAYAEFKNERYVLLESGLYTL